MTRSFAVCSPHRILFYQIKKNEMGRECRIYGGQERFIQNFGGET